LWAKTHTHFSPPVDLILVDTANPYVEGDTQGQITQYGKSKDKRYNRRLLSIVLG
jgi:hypothetical protein